MAFWNNLYPGSTSGTGFGDRNLVSLLPEFGITELFGGKTGSLQPGTDYLWGQVQAAETQPQPQQSVRQDYWNTSPYNTSGDVAGVDTTQQQSVGTSGGGGGSTGGGDSSGGGDTGGGDSGGGKTQAELEREALEAQRGILGNRYQSYMDALDQYAGTLPGYRTEREEGVQDLYQSQLGDIQTQEQAALRPFDKYRGDVRESQSLAISDLADNMRQAMTAAGRYLGARGAGSSSANQMLQYALTNQANQQRGDILRQTRGMMQDLNMKEQGVKDTYAQERSRLDTWKSEKLNEVSGWYQNAMQKIDEMRSQTGMESADQIANMEMQAVEQAKSRLAQLDQQAREWNSALDQWAMQRMGDITQAKAAQGDYANWSPGQIMQQELSAIPGTRQQAEVAMPNPYLLRKREEEDEAAGLFANVWQ